MERDVALSTRLISQSPMGLAILDTDLRYVSVNPALERMHGIPADDHLGRGYREIMTHARFEVVEAAMQQVLETGIPMIDQSTVVGRAPADPEHEHAWSISLYRLEDPQGRVLGVAELVVDVTDRQQAAMEAAKARWRLALIADSSVRIGTTLEVGKTARELAEVTVPELADVVAVDVLDSVLEDCHLADRDGPAIFRALAVKAAYPTEAAEAADRPGHLASYGIGRLATECVRTGRPILITQADDNDLARIARDDHAAALLARAGVHSYIAVPLTAHGQTLGFLGLTRARNPLPFDEDDLALAGELASRTAMCIDNACSHQRVRNAAETLQRSLLPELPPRRPGLEVASRYRPAQAAFEVGGDWYDVLPLDGDKTALVVGDVMGSGIGAAATMGRLCTATGAFADLDLDPAEVLRHLDKITSGLGHPIVTCVYAVYDPHRAECHIATAGHLPPSSCAAAGIRNCSTCPPASRWEWVASPSRPPPSTSAPATSWSCTPTDWSKPATTPSTRASRLSSACWTRPTVPWRKPVTGSFMSCGVLTTPMTSPCSSPGRSPSSPQGETPAHWWCEPARAPQDVSQRRPGPVSAGGYGLSACWMWAAMAGSLMPFPPVSTRPAKRRSSDEPSTVTVKSYQ